MKNYHFLLFLFMATVLTGCTNETVTSITNEEKVAQETHASTIEQVSEKEETLPTVVEEPVKEEPTPEPKSDRFERHKQIDVDGGDLSGNRQPNVVVDIGFGDREYWAFTNEHGQVVRVIAEEIILQDDTLEPVLSSGRYYSDEAKVPGVNRNTLDAGHIIADSLGGVANAYNITPQDSTLNRHGDQAYMEDVIRKAGGVTNFEAIITYPTTKTQIPSRYQYTYTVQGNVIVDTFDNVNPEELNVTQNNKTNDVSTSDNSTTTNAIVEGDVSTIDVNGNGQVTIKEAKAAGFTMPIMSDHWLYPYMRDNDHDGMVGE